MEKNRLFRSTENRKIFGVCGGLGERFGIDPNLVRIAALILFFLTRGIVLWAYLLLGFLLPQQDQERPGAQASSTWRSQWDARRNAEQNRPRDDWKQDAQDVDAHAADSGGATAEHDEEAFFRQSREVADDDFEK